MYVTLLCESLTLIFIYNCLEWSKERGDDPSILSNIVDQLANVQKAYTEKENIDNNIADLCSAVEENVLLLCEFRSYG